MIPKKVIDVYLICKSLFGHNIASFGVQPLFSYVADLDRGEKSIFDGVEKSIFEVKLEFGSHVIYVFSSIVIGGASFPLVDLLDHKF